MKPLVLLIRTKWSCLSSLVLSALKRPEGIKWICLSPADTCIAESNAEILKQNYLRKENAETLVII